MRVAAWPHPGRKTRNSTAVTKLNVLSANGLLAGFVEGHAGNSARHEARRSFGHYRGELQEGSVRSSATAGDEALALHKSKCGGTSSIIFGSGLHRSSDF